MTKTSLFTIFLSHNAVQWEKKYGWLQQNCKQLMKQYSEYVLAEFHQWRGTQVCLENNLLLHENLCF